MSVGDEVTVLFLPDFRDGNPYQANLASALEELGVTVEFGTTGGLFPIWRSILGVRSVDVVHLHWLSPYLLGGTRVTAIVKSLLTLLQLVVVRRFGVSVVWTVHNVTPHGMRYPRIDRRFFGLVVRSCDRFVVHCEATGQELVETYQDGHVDGRTRVVPHGHYVDNYENTVSRDEGRAALSIDPPGTTFLFFGLVRRYKGIERLIDAFDVAAADDSLLLIVGAPENHAFAEEIATEVADRDRVRAVFEFVPDDEVQRYMNAADVVVLPYRDVTTSGTAVLAMSFGRAVITPRAGCAPSLLDDDGWYLYEPEGGLETAIRTAEVADLDSIGVRNLHTISRHDWGRIAERTAEVYAES